MPTELVVQQYIMQEYYSVLQVFTDGSKEPESGRTAAAVYIPTVKIKLQKDYQIMCQILLLKLLAIILALQWIEEKFNQKDCDM